MLASDFFRSSHTFYGKTIHTIIVQLITLCLCSTTSGNLFSPPGCWKQAWRAILLLFLIYFLTIPVRPIISKSTRSISSKFSGLSYYGCRWSIWSHFFNPSRDVAMATNFVGFIHMLCSSIWWLPKITVLCKTQSCMCSAYIHTYMHTDTWKHAQQSGTRLESEERVVARWQEYSWY